MQVQLSGWAAEEASGGAPSMAAVPPLLWLDGRGVGVVPPLLHISCEDTGRERGEGGERGGVRMMA